MKDLGRDLYLFDSFEGMPEPSVNDVDYSGKRASEVPSEDSGYKCEDAPLEPVKDMLYGTGYARGKIHFVRGKVEDTEPEFAPDTISLPWLDTDLYASTKHELVHLSSRLIESCPAIIED